MNYFGHFSHRTQYFMGVSHIRSCVEDFRIPMGNDNCTEIERHEWWTPEKEIEKSVKKFPILGVFVSVPSRVLSQCKMREEFDTGMQK